MSRIVALKCTSILRSCRIPLFESFAMYTAFYQTLLKLLVRVYEESPRGAEDFGRMDECNHCICVGVNKQWFLLNNNSCNAKRIMSV